MAQPKLDFLRTQLRRLSAGRDALGKKIITPVADEHVFRRMLLLERRRCERTGIPFGLALLDVERLESTLKAEELEELAESVGAAMRETDLTGWYRQSSTIGIILTTSNGVDPVTLKSVIVERINSILALHLSTGQRQHIRISVYIFPEQVSDGDLVGTAPEFYSHQQTESLKRKVDAASKRDRKSVV